MSDVSEYLADRQARGFNALWVILTDQLDQNGAPNDANGNPPFNGAWWVSPNATYWAHQDAVIQAAIAAGMTVFAMPSFVGNNDPQPAYDTPAYLASSTATIQGYGTFIGSRYANYSNIVWVLGGDYNPVSSSGVTIKPKLEALGAAIAAADPNHFITIEGCKHCGYPMSTSPYTSTTLPSWLKLNWVDTTGANAVTSCQAAYASGLFLPPVEGEDSYELEGGTTGFQARQEGYWEVLSGCYAGRIFGNGPIWSFNAAHSGDTSPSWQSQLDSLGSLGQEYMGRLMRSREHWLMAPDISHTYLTAGFGSGNSTSVAARSSDGQTIIVYDPVGNTQAFTVNMAGITSASSTVKEWWYNPSNGVSSPIGTHANSGSVVFTAPDANDWVLVLDDASANLSAPGGGSVTISPSSENFGSVTVGHPSSGMASIVTNSTAAAITISTINYTGTNALDFSTSATTCSGSLAANGGSCTITTTFTPSILGVETATLNFAFTGASGSPIVVSVFGTGGSPGVGSCVETQTTTPSVGINVGRHVAETENNSTNDATQAIKPGGVCHAIQ